MWTKARYLLNTDGSAFDDLDAVTAVLRDLPNDARVGYRDGNAALIAADGTERLLVVAGPGAGKSHLFIARIKEWLAFHADGKVYVATFVRKLIRDLERDISTKLSSEEAMRVTASTLHTLARSLVERSGGTSELHLGRYVRVVDGHWAGVVWRDVLAFHPDLNHSSYSLRRFESQLHTETLDESDEWVQIRETHARLSAFYNAVGFAHFIVLAREAVEATSTLVDHDLWIIDEYQDFNAAEDHLVRSLVANAAGVLLAGDDEQALYQTLKASKPEIIIGYYNDATFAKAMLPFCSRCSYHVCNAASAFMEKHRTDEAIEKIYLPLKIDEGAPRVQVIATASPGAAVEYVRAFLEEHTDEFNAYLERRAAGIDTDPFVLILSPSGGLTPKKNDPADTELRDLVAAYAALGSSRSIDYARLIVYSTAGWYGNDNFAVRKLLHEADIPDDEIHEMLDEALDARETLGEVAARRSNVIDQAGYVASLLEEAEGDELRAVSEIAKIIAVEDEAALAAELREHPIHETAVRVDEDERAIESISAVEPVAVMPITGSKGLSAHHVIALGCDNINMNKTSALSFFVALTRARGSLHLIFAAKASGAKSLHPFVTELPEESCDYRVFKKDRSVDDFESVDGLVLRVKTWSSFTRKR